MGKAKKSALKKRSSKPYSKHENPKVKSKNASTSPRKPGSQTNPTIPFKSTDRILLIGEGDLSFSNALLATHNCTSLLATCFDSHPIVLAKYPQAALNIQALTDAQGPHVLYDVDATRIGTGRVNSGGKAVKKGGFDRIVFNFPHVGGLTKDVDRQIRHNQELLLGFFKAARPLLAGAANGTIVVTIFEGEPYDKWDLRGLAREAGLKSQRSFTFQSTAYPGYRHARTLGNLVGEGGWKGEERPARSYVLEVDGRLLASGKTGEGEGSAGATGPNMDPVTSRRDANGKKTMSKKQEDSDSDDD